MYKRLDGVLIPLLVCVPLLLWRLGTAPPVWFDEGYKMHAAYQWAFRGFYGTETVAGAIPFDPGISTGPADLLAVALAFRLLGVTVLAARLAPAAYALVLAAGIYGLVRLMEDRAPSNRRALWATLLVLAVPPVQGVGAIAAK